MHTTKPKIYQFIKYQSMMDESTIVYALANDGVVQMIEGIKFIEVTPDFMSVHMVRADSIKAIGTSERTY